MSNQIKYKCIHLTHVDKFYGYGQQSRQPEDYKRLTDQYGNNSNNDPVSVTFTHYTCKEEGCGMKYTSIDCRKNNGNIRFFTGDIEVNNFTDCMMLYNSGNHFAEE